MSANCASDHPFREPCSLSTFFYDVALEFLYLICDADELSFCRTFLQEIRLLALP